MTKYDLIVARYNENIDWLNDLDFNKYNFIIYNKGKKDIVFSEQLPNIGREAQTYIHYIVNNYNNLPEFCIFIQGDPDTHCKNYKDIINSHVDYPFVFLSSDIIVESSNGWYEFLHEKEREFPRSLLINVVNRFLSDNPAPRYVKFGAGAQFIVSKELILNRSLEYYLELYDRFKIDYLLPWHLERIWGYIFKAEQYFV